MSDTPQEFNRTMRLQRFLARAGVASRRGSERLITEGRVCVNGHVVRELGSKVIPDIDEISVDGILVVLQDESTYIILNKPKAYLTTMSDPYGRHTVKELIPADIYPGLFPVGRLDQDTTGILLFTTNGDVGQALLHPSKHVNKHYIALVDGMPDELGLTLIRQGITLEDGPCAPACIELLDKSHQLVCELFNPSDYNRFNAVSLTIHEGRKHQVKRMLEAIHAPVVELHRHSFGPLTSDGLALGEWRFVTDVEKATLEGMVEES